MRGAAVQPLTLPKPLNALKRHSFRHWMWRCEMARLRGFGQHDWMIPSVPAGVISVDGAKVEYNLQSTTPVAVASIIVATVHKGVDEVEVQYRDAAALVDGVLMQVDDLHKNDREAANDAHREAFREALIVRVEERLKEPRERLSTIRSPCPELLDEIGRGEDELFEVRYVDDLEGIADRILSERNINHMIFAPKGSGKTQVVMRPLANSIEDGIAVSHRVILADSAASTLKCRHYQTRDFPHEIELTGWKTYCVNSLIKPDGEREARSADCIVFDEFHGIMESIAKGRGRGSGMAEADKVFELLKRVLSNRGKPRTLMKDDKTVVMMDAGISHKDLLFARSVSKAAGKKLVLWLVQATPESKEKAHVEACLNGRGASNRKHVVIVPDEATLNALVISAHNQHPNNVIFQGSTTKLGIMASSKYVSAQDDENICLTANTKDERMVADYVRDPNQFVEKNTLWHVGLSPAGSEGLSLESARYHTDVFLSYTTNKLVSYQTVDQMSGRVRAAERVFISFGNHADDNPNAGIEDDDVERGNLRRAEVALEFVQGRPGDVEKVLDSYSTFATWYRQDIEYSRLHGKQLLMMKWKEEDYTFEYPEPIYDDWSTKEDKMAGIKCEVKEAIEQGMLDALELRGEDYKTLAGFAEAGDNGDGLYD